MITVVRHRYTLFIILLLGMLVREPLLLGEIYHLSSVQSSVTEVARSDSKGMSFITIADYGLFLNAVAKSDPYGLYKQKMGSDAVNGGIIRRGLPGSYSYFVIEGREQLPLIYLSCSDGARYCNWVENGCLRGAQASSTTEYGAYELSGKYEVLGRLMPEAKYFFISEGGDLNGNTSASLASDQIKGRLVSVASTHSLAMERPLSWISSHKNKIMITCILSIIAARAALKCSNRSYPEDSEESGISSSFVNSQETRSVQPLQGSLQKPTPSLSKVVRTESFPGDLFPTTPKENSCTTTNKLREKKELKGNEGSSAAILAATGFLNEDVDNPEIRESYEQVVDKTPPNVRSERGAPSTKKRSKQKDSRVSQASNDEEHKDGQLTFSDFLNDSHSGDRKKESNGLKEKNKRHSLLSAGSLLFPSKTSVAARRVSYVPEDHEESQIETELSKTIKENTPMITGARYDAVLRDATPSAKTTIKAEDQWIINIVQQALDEMNQAYDQLEYPLDSFEQHRFVRWQTYDQHDSVIRITEERIAEEIALVNEELQQIQEKGGIDDPEYQENLLYLQDLQNNPEEYLKETVQYFSKLVSNLDSPDANNILIALQQEHGLYKKNALSNNDPVFRPKK